MKNPIKLYWVETPSPEENCFVAAHSKRAAAKYEEDGTGFETGTCDAVLVRSLNLDWVTKYRGGKLPPDDRVWPFYVQLEDVNELDIEWRIIEGDDVFKYNGRRFVKQGDLSYIASLGENPESVVIRSVSDLLDLIAHELDGDWIFRGQSSCRWPLIASVHRLTEGPNATLEQVVRFERKLLIEFKRRARIFLQSPPTSDWEWMVLAQHFGLPTRILDWTENPLVALYFASTGSPDISDDGMLYAYRHGAQEVDIESPSDPFAISKIELIRPPHLDQRVIAQKSIFTAEPPFLKEKTNRQNSDIRYRYVSINHKHRIRAELEKLGILESSLFPGLTSIATEIKNDLSIAQILAEVLPAIAANVGGPSSNSHDAEEDDT